MAVIDHHTRWERGITNHMALTTAAGACSNIWSSLGYRTFGAPWIIGCPTLGFHEFAPYDNMLVENRAAAVDAAVEGPEQGPQQ